MPDCPEMSYVAQDVVVFPQSFAQQRLWFIDRLLAQRSGYHITSAIRLDGRLDHDALRSALERIVDRHEALRTTFAIIEDEPAQLIAPALSLPLEITDVRDVEAFGETHLERMIDEDARAPFDLARGPLFRLRLIVLGSDRHVLVLVIHHIIADGWSLGVLYEELGLLYNALLDGRDPDSALGELPIQYADFSQWQRGWLQGEVLDAQLTHWTQRLDGLRHLELPTDRPRPVMQSPHGAAVERRLPEDLVRRVRAIAQQQQCTFFMAALTAFSLMLRRYCDQTDVVVASPIANRNRSEIEPLIGFFANIVVMRTRVDDDRTFRELLERTRDAALADYDHQDLPFEMIVEALQPQRDMSRNPLVQVIFADQNAPMAPPMMDGLDVRNLRPGASLTRFDIEMHLEPEGDETIAHCIYNRDLFNPETAERMLDHFQKLLESAVATPDRPVGALAMLDDDERRPIRAAARGRSTTRDITPPLLHAIVEDRARRSPDSCAVQCGSTSLTFADLDRQTVRWARHLRSIGVDRRTRVALALPSGLEQAVAMLAVLKAGGTCVPPTDDAAVRFTRNDDASDTDCIVVDVGTISDRIEACEIKDLPFVNEPDDPAVELAGLEPCRASHRSLAALVEWQIEDLSLNERDRVASRAPITSLPGALAMFATWGAGGTVCIEEPDQDDQAGRLFAPDITRAFLPSTALVEVVVTMRGNADADPSALKSVVAYGEPIRIDAHLAALFTELSCRLQLQLHLTGGDGIAVCTHHLDDDPSHWPEFPPIGPPSHGSVSVLDDHGAPVPIGVPGRLCLDDDPAGQRVRRRRDGLLDYVGRVGDRIEIRGHRVEARAVEHALAAHPRVRQCVVIVDRENDSERLIAGIVPEDGAALPTEVQWHQFLAARIAAPSLDTVFVPIDRIPLGPDGAVDRASLPRPPRGAVDASTHATATPRTAVEEMLAGSWCEVLGIDEVGLHDDFFELGGHSLLATQLFSRIASAFGVEIPLHHLFELPTIDALARHIEAARGASRAAPAPIQPEPEASPAPLSFAQQRMWLLDQMMPGQCVYNIPVSIDLRGPVRIDALQRSLEKTIRRHDVLRTTFDVEAGRPVQRVLDSASIEMPVEDVTPEDLDRRCLAEAQRPFDLARGPVMRARLYRVGSADPRHVLMLTIHHVCFDGWSTGILFQELADLYEAELSRKPTAAPLPNQYADFARWQRAGSDQAQSVDLDYWTRRLDHMPPPLCLPSDRRRPHVQTFEGATHRFEIPEDTTARIDALCRASGVTRFMALLAAFQVLLARYTGEHDLAVGTPIANRNRVEIEPLIGFFVNTLVMRTDLSGDPSFIELLGRVRRTALDAYDHQDLPFEQLVDHLQPDRTLSSNPLFNLMFVLQNTPPPARTVGPLTLEARFGDNGAAPFDLLLSITPHSKQWHGAVKYNRDLFDTATIEVMAGLYRTLLESIADDPEQPISDLRILDDTQRADALRRGMACTSQYPRDATIHAQFEQQAQRNPNAEAVVYDDVVLTYGELDRRADHLARRLVRLGIGPDVPVAILMERSADLIIALLGILKAGGAYVPLSPEDPAARLADMLDDTRAPVIIADRRHREAAIGPAIVVHVDDDGPPLSHDAPLPQVRADHLAYIIYTSGSTGRPKGVAIDHRAVLRLVCECNYIDIEPSDRVAQGSTVTFDAATFEIWSPLLHGAGLVGVGRDELLSPDLLGRRIRDDGINVLFLTTALFNHLAVTSPAIFRPLRHLLFGGEACDPAAVRVVLADGAPGRLVHVYGPTECTTFATWHDVTDVADDAVTVPIGHPVSSTETYVLDECHQPVAAGVPGELYLGGDGLARGYHRRPDLTKERFATINLDGTARRLYRTGDRVRCRADGAIEFMGRVDDGQVKIRGFRVELAEIERTLTGASGVDACAVLYRRDGSDAPSLTAYFRGHAEASDHADEAALRQFARQHLPHYMVPDIFMRLPEMPLTSGGKIDRNALPAPNRHRSPADAFVPPSNEAERRIADLWRDVLNHERVGIDDNFFDLGGNSLRLSVLRIRLQETLAIPIRMADLFLYPTVRTLAAFAARGHDTDAADAGRDRAAARRSAPRRPRRRQSARESS